MRLQDTASLVAAKSLSEKFTPVYEDEGIVAARMFVEENPFKPERFKPFISVRPP